MTRSLKSLLAAVAIVAISTVAAAAADDAPKIIRFGGVGSGYGQPNGTGLIAIAQLKGFVQDEFKDEPVTLEWDYFAGTGPAINEALASGQLDFAQYGALPSVIARANDVATRIVLSGGGTNLYGIARTALPIDSVKDLKGRKVAVQKATILQWSLVRALEANGLTARDVTILDLKQADQLAALAAGSADAAFGSSSLLSLRDQGIVKVFYQSKNDPQRSGPNALAVTEDFAQKYPAATERVVRGFVRAAEWLSREENREEAVQLWSKSGVPASVLRDDISGAPLREQFDPRLDAFSLSQYRDTISFAKEQHLIRATFELSQWFDTHDQDAALHELGLEALWPARDAAATN
jgi:sulfonate transport system substrate-binding protein